MSNSDQELVSKWYRRLSDNCDFYEDEAKNNDNESEKFFEKLKTYASSGEIVEYQKTNELKVRINIGATCLLKKIGDKVLDNQLVKDKYQEIKLQILDNYFREQEDGDETKMNDLQRVENRDQTRRKKTEYIRADDIGPMFHLARIKVNMQLDKSVAIHALYQIKVKGFHDFKKHEFKTQENEKLTIYESGKIVHGVECSQPYEKKVCKRYEQLATMWQNWFNNNNAYSVTEIKTILKIFLRGDDGMYDWFSSENNKLWRFVIELIFGVEIKRSSHAILTNAMFFELVNKGKYKLSDLYDKLPSALEGFVEGSCNVDMIMNKTMFDFRDKYESASEAVPKVGDEAKNLAERDRDILKDWLVEVKGAISDITDRTEIIKIKSKYLFDLIDDWYGIEIKDLNTDEELKWHFSVTNVYNGVCKESCSQ